VYEHNDIADVLDPLHEREEQPRASTSHLAGSRFSKTVRCEQVLEMFHLERVRTDINGDTHWHFPGSANDTSCTVYAEDNHCTIWSETMASFFGLEIRRPYDSFGLWTWLKHGGDFAVAHADLEQHGITDLGSGRRAQQAEKSPTRLRVVVADGVTGERVKWLWYAWLPAGKLTVLDGDPDVGKSTLSLDIAARVTRGATMPDGTAGIAASNVVLLSAEDDMSDTIIWRLKAAGADLSRVSHIQAALDDDNAETPLTIPRDLGLIEQHVTERNAALVIIDVLFEYLDEQVNTNNDAKTRRALHHVRALAQHTGAAVIALRHFKKAPTDKAIHRGGGSIAIVGAARAAWAAARHPDDPDPLMRVLVVIKSNLAIRPEALTYRLVGHADYPCAFVEWCGTIPMDADALLDPAQRQRSEEKEEAATVMQRTIDAICMFLPVGRENAMLSHELRKMVVEAVRCSKRTYDSAHARIDFGPGWRVQQVDGIAGMMVWRPDPDRPSQDAPDDTQSGE
jgi:hypothetical protein